MTRARRGVGAWLLLTMTMMCPGVGKAQPFHVDPACWTEPRVTHAGPPPAEFANRLHLIETPAVAMSGSPLVAADRRTRLWLRQPDTTRPPPWGAALVVDRGGDRHRTLLVEDIGAPLAPRWLNTRWVFLRVVWGRAVFSDLVLDVQTGELRYHELARDGGAAFEQYRAACRGRCPCDPALARDADDPARFAVEAPIPAARPGAQAMIGLLLLPGLFGPPESGGVVAADPLRPVPVYAEPDAGAAPTLHLAAPDAVEYREYTYEGAAAVVFEQRSGWYAVALRDAPIARGWIRAADAGEFLPLTELLPNRLSYLNAHWDGHLWSGPGQGRRTGRASTLVGATPDASTEIPIELLDLRRVGDGLWLQVQTLDQSPCTGTTPQVVDRGWIPAYASDGALVMGYYSRGC